MVPSEFEVRFVFVNLKLKKKKSKTNTMLYVNYNSNKQFKIFYPSIIKYFSMILILKVNVKL